MKTPMSELTTNKRLFVIGSPNGQDDLLRLMLTQIEDYSIGKEDVVVFMGNYIHRAGDPQACLEAVRFYQQMRIHNTIVMLGRNEYKYLTGKMQFLKSPEGRNLIESYRVKSSYPYNTLRDRSLRVPTMLNHRTWLSRQTRFWFNDNLFVCHGGLNPAKPLIDQTIGTLIFGNSSEEFLKSTKNYGKMVVTSANPEPFGKVTSKRNRVCVDSSPETSGVLSCVIFDLESGDVKDVVTVKRSS